MACLSITRGGGVSYPSPQEEHSVSLRGRKVDFALPYDWKKQALRITLLVLKIIIIPWGLGEGLRYLVSRIVMSLVYPVQSSLAKKYRPEWQPSQVALAGQGALVELQRRGYEAKHVILEKQGIRYSGYEVAFSDSKNRDCWVLQAVGNSMTAENSLIGFVESYQGAGFNLLIVNGPSVGLSEGTATRETMGDAQEVALSYLEEVKRAKKIALSGFSLGSAALSEAILQHAFKKECHYAVIRQMTFSSLDLVVKDLVNKRMNSSWLGSAAAGLVSFSGLNMNNREASQKLQGLGIEEVVLQSTISSLSNKPTVLLRPDKALFVDDDVICGEASHGYYLAQQEMPKGITFIGLPRTSHNCPTIYAVTATVLARCLQFGTE